MGAICVKEKYKANFPSNEMKVVNQRSKSYQPTEGQINTTQMAKGRKKASSQINRGN